MEALVQSPAPITMDSCAPLIIVRDEVPDCMEPGVPFCPLSIITLLSHTAIVAFCMVLQGKYMHQAYAPGEDSWTPPPLI